MIKTIGMIFKNPHRVLQIIITIITLIKLITVQTVSASVSYQYEDYRSLIGRRGSVMRMSSTKIPQIGIISHHLPTAAPMLNDFYAQVKRARPEIKTFVVIGPDHFEKCRQKFSISKQLIYTMFGELKVDKNIFSQLISAGVREEVACFRGEHAIGVQASYIKKYFPEAHVVPVLLSYAARNRDFQKTIEVLKKNKNDIFVLASLDFTHYVDARSADANDEISRKMLISQNAIGFTLKQVDSPATMKLILQLARELKLKTMILDHKNSFDYNGSFNNTTSYFSVLFGR